MLLFFIVIIFQGSVINFDDLKYVIVIGPSGVQFRE